MLLRNYIARKCFTGLMLVMPFLDVPCAERYDAVEEEEVLVVMGEETRRENKRESEIDDMLRSKIKPRCLYDANNFNVVELKNLEGRITYVGESDFDSDGKSEILGVTDRQEVFFLRGGK